MNIVAIDTETTGTDFDHGCLPFMITACDGKDNYYWEGRVNPKNRADVYWAKEVIDDFEDFLRDYDTYVFHNAKFDVKALSCIGIDIPWDKVEDTMIASHVLCSGEKHGLKYLAFKYLGYYNEGERTLDLAVQRARMQADASVDVAKLGHPCFPGLTTGQKWYKMDMWLCMDECLEYGLADVEMTWLLWDMHQDVLDAEDLWEQYETRRNLLPIISAMEEAGLYLYLEPLSQEIKRLEAFRESMRAAIQNEIRILHHLDLQNERHIRAFLFEILKLKPYILTEKTKQPSIGKDSLEYFIRTNPDCRPLQYFAEYRKAGTKIGYLSSYAKYACDDSRVRSNILITGTRETRQASTAPNVQNIDKNLRHIFGPPPGRVWLDYDLVNIEMRIWTYEVGNKELIEVFEAGGSVHLLIASIIHPELFKKCQDEGVEFNKEYASSWYSWTKNGNFAIIYGATPRKADKTYKKEGCYNKIARRFPQVPAYTGKTIDEAERNDRSKNAPFVTCVGGYRLDINMDEPFKACNYKIQGSAGYIINHAMINVVNNPFYKDSSARIVNQVHDSIVIELDEEDNTPELQQSIKTSIEEAGLRYLPTCSASFDIVECRHKELVG